MGQTRTILVVGHSNIGDAIMASPVLEDLHGRFPGAHLTLCVGKRAKGLFAHDKRVSRLIEVDAFCGIRGRLRFGAFVMREHPDVLVDLRQTALPLVWKPWRALRYYWPVPSRFVHMKDRHLWRMRRQLSSFFGWPERLGSRSGNAELALRIPQEAKAHAGYLLNRWGLDQHKPLVIICAGARGYTRRWYADRFAKLADRLIAQTDTEIIFTGESDDSKLINEIIGLMRQRAHNAVGSTTAIQLGALMERAQLVIVQDSGTVHLASASGVAVLALFGPSDPRRYGPSGASHRVIQRRLFCSPCEVSDCRFSHECMRFITADEAFDAARELLRQSTLETSASESTTISEAKKEKSVG